MREKPNSFARAGRSIGKEQPARAPRSHRTRVSACSGMLQACQVAGECLRMSHQENARAEIGWACCMCVMPAMGTFRLAFACIRKPFSKASRLLRISAAASMTNRRKISGDKFVAAPAGVQFSSRAAQVPQQEHSRRTDAHLPQVEESSQLLSVCAPSGDFVEGCKSLPHFHFGENAYSLQSLCPRRNPRRFRREAAGDRTQTNAGRRPKARIWRVFQNALPHSRSSLRSGFTCSISRENAQEFSLLGFCHCLLRSK